MRIRRLKILGVAMALAGLAALLGIVLYLLPREAAPSINRTADFVLVNEATSFAREHGPTESLLRLPDWDDENEQLRLIAIDESSMSDPRDPAHPGLGQFPWPRSLYGKLLQRLHRAGASVVAFDIEFFEPSADPAQDAAFAAGMRAQRTVLGESLNITTGGILQPQQRRRLLRLQDAAGRDVERLAEHRALRAHPGCERGVLRRVRRWLEELDVERDDARAGAVQALQQLAVQRTRPGKLAEPGVRRIARIAHRAFVDRDQAQLLVLVVPVRQPQQRFGGAVFAREHGPTESLLRLPDWDDENEQLRLIAIDESSMSDPRDPAHPGLGQFPWPRSLYGKLLQRLHRAGASVVAFDIEFFEPSADPAQDAAFAAGMRAQRTVLGESLNITTGGILQPQQRRTGSV